MERKKTTKKATVPKSSKPKAPTDESALVVALREAITGAGRTHYAIAKDAGITPEILDRFVRGDRGMTLATAGKVADVLGYELTKISSSGTSS
jgi:DNA-binding phage protein